MRLSPFYNPFDIITRLAIEINRYRRKRKLKNTPGEKLKLKYLDSLELLELIKSKDVLTIYDIGANIGTWSLLAYSFFPNAGIYAFEPLNEHIIKYKSTTSRIKNINLLQCCLGNHNDQFPINVSSFSDSSSLLEATSLEFEEYGIKKIRQENVEVLKAETLISKKIIKIPQLIKIDVQGYELEVLKGFGEYISDVKFIICEVCFKEYYKSQPLFLDISNYLNEYGFSIHSFGLNTTLGKELGQIDVLFQNRNK